MVYRSTKIPMEISNIPVAINSWFIFSPYHSLRPVRPFSGIGHETLVATVYRSDDSGLRSRRNLPSIASGIFCDIRISRRLEGQLTVPGAVSLCDRKSFPGPRPPNLDGFDSKRSSGSRPYFLRIIQYFNVAILSLYP